MTPVRTVDLSSLIPLFLVRLEQRLIALNAALAEIVGGSREMLENASREFHSLAGIGGTYGFPEVTVLARRGEDLLQLPLSEDRPVLPTEAATAQLLVTQIDAVRTSAAGGSC